MKSLLLFTYSVKCSDDCNFQYSGWSAPTNVNLDNLHNNGFIAISRVDFPLSFNEKKYYPSAAKAEEGYLGLRSVTVNR